MDKCKCSVRVNNLCVRRGGHLVINNVTFTANHGETLALIGQNGAGKTTLLKAILGSVDYTGSVKFFDSENKSIMCPKIGYVPQRLSFDRNTPMTVLDLFCANFSNMPVWLWHSKKAKNKALEILEKVDAQNNLYKPIGSLSGGELQRVLLAFALEPRPDILLLDEPVSAVDRRGISKFYSLIESMREDFHMPVILVSHDLGHVAKYANSYALIDRSIMEIGSAKNLYKSSKVREAFGLNIDGGEEAWK